MTASLVLTKNVVPNVKNSKNVSIKADSNAQKMKNLVRKMITKCAWKAIRRVRIKVTAARDNVAEADEEIRVNQERKVEKRESHLKISRAFGTMLILLAVCTILFGSCSRPDDGYRYIHLDPNCDSIPVFTFSLPVIDSTTICTTFIAVRYDCRLHSNSVSFAVDITSPDSEVFTEKITLPLTESSQVEIRRSRFGIVDIKWPYRENIKASEGEWSIAMTPLHEDATKWLHGVGFSYHFNK